MLVKIIAWYEINSMKSAYELAMERLEKEDPSTTKSLNDEQRKQLAEIDKRYDAKIAEKEIFLKDKINKADPQERHMIEEQLANERERLNDERETEKDKIRENRPLL